MQQPRALSVVEEKKRAGRAAHGDVSWCWDDFRVDLPVVFLDLVRVVFRSVLLLSLLRLLLLRWVTCAPPALRPAPYGLKAPRHYYSQDDSFTLTGCRDGRPSFLIRNTVGQDCLSRPQGGLANERFVLVQS